MAQGSRRDIRYIAETQWGSTPTTPTMVSIRNTGGAGMQIARQSVVSGEYNSLRAIKDLIMGNKRPTLEMPFELSYGTFDAWLEAALGGTWSDDVLKCGTTLGSFSVEEAFTDIGVYLLMTGAMVNTFSLSIQPEQPITGSFGLVGKDLTVAATTAAAKVTAANTNPVFNSFSGSISIDGTESQIITGLSLSLANGCDPKYALFDPVAKRIGVGRTAITGNLTAMFNDKKLLDAWLNGTEMALEIELEDSEENIYLIELPRVKYSGESRSNSENDSIQTLPFQALHDDDDTTMMITRTAGA